MVKDIEKVIKILKKESRKWKDPIVTEVSKTRSPYEVLISCLLSLRTKDEVTAKASAKLFKLARNPKKMLSLTTKQIEKAIFPVGFYKTKAKNIKSVSKDLISKYNSKVPDEIEELLKLHGVGRKTANIVLAFAYNKQALPIDTHCHRIPNRLGWIKTKTPEETEFALRKILPRKHWIDFNNIFVAFGQNICRPIGPKCNICPVNKYCDYYKKVYLKR
ncbi:endonuclease III [Candidatus Woesearchaeota archaeon]|nr:endonuclease III [Candidatus Woesearchaeota archaeon]